MEEMPRALAGRARPGPCLEPGQRAAVRRGSNIYLFLCLKKTLSGPLSSPLPDSLQVIQRVSRMAEPTNEMATPVMNTYTHRGTSSVGAEQRDVCLGGL